jgi:hypothetical protein
MLYVGLPIIAAYSFPKSPPKAIIQHLKQRKKRSGNTSKARLALPPNDLLQKYIKTEK